MFYSLVRTFLKMAKTFIAKLAQPGIDVKTAGDEHLVYNSNWPLLKIVKQGSFKTSEFGTSGKVIVAHDLGYVPFFFYFANTDITMWEGSSAVPPIVDTSRSEFLGNTLLSPSITDSALLFDGGIHGSTSVGTIQLYYYIFALDITAPYTAPQIKSGGVIGPRNTKTAFKLAKPGKDISSSRLEDYIVNSDARSPMVHAVYQGVTKPNGSVAGYGFTVTHGLGYIPMFFAFAKTGGNFGIDGAISGSWTTLYPSSAISGFTVDTQTIQYNNLNQDEHIALVVLKDPFEIDYSVSVSV